MEEKGFYLPMYYCGYVNGKYYSFPTEEEYHEYMEELRQEEDSED